MIEAEVLFNPNAGRVRALGISEERLLGILNEHGISASLRLADGIGHAVRAFADVDPGKLFIIAGGDGTLFQAVQASVCRSSPVGLMPLGTANDLARSLGIPLDLHSAAEVIARGQFTRIDLGLAGGRVFIQAAGIGFHAEALSIYGERRRHSRARALRAFVMSLRNYRPVPVRLTIDRATEECQVTQVTVANTPVYGPRIPIAPDARVDDGILDVVTLGVMTKSEIVRMTYRVLKGWPVEAENLTRVPARTVDIQPVVGSPASSVHADGESIGRIPVHIEVLPSCLKLIVPA